MDLLSIMKSSRMIKKVKQDYGNAQDRTEAEGYMTAVIPAFNVKVAEYSYPMDSKYYVYIPDYCYDEHADPLKVQSVMDDLVDPAGGF